MISIPHRDKAIAPITTSERSAEGDALAPHRVIPPPHRMATWRSSLTTEYSSVRDGTTEGGRHARGFTSGQDVIPGIPWPWRASSLCLSWSRQPRDCGLRTPIATPCRPGRARIGTYDLRTCDHINQLAFSPDGRLIAAAEHRNSTSNVSLFDVKTGRQARRLVVPDQPGLHCRPPRLLARWDDPRLVGLSRTTGPSMRLWDLAADRLLYREELTERPANTAAFSPDGRLIAIGYEDGIVRVRSVKALAAADGRARPGGEPAPDPSGPGPGRSRFEDPQPRVHARRDPARRGGIRRCLGLDLRLAPGGRPAALEDRQGPRPPRDHEESQPVLPGRDARRATGPVRPASKMHRTIGSRPIDIWANRPVPRSAPGTSRRARGTALISAMTRPPYWPMRRCRATAGISSCPGAIPSASSMP